MNPEPNGGQGADWEAQMIDYAMGTLPAASTAEFERQLDECRAHVALAGKYMETVGLLGHAVAPAAPPAGHRERFAARLARSPRDAQEAPVLGDVADVAGTVAGGYFPKATTEPAVSGESGGGGVLSLAEHREARTRQYLWPAFATVAAALVLLLGGWGWTTQSQLDTTRRDEAALRRQLDTAATDQARLQEQVSTMQGALNVPPGYVPFPVRSTGVITNAWAVCLVNRNGNDMLLMANGLTPLAADRVYELWWLPADTAVAPLRGGEFTADHAGIGRQWAKIPDPRNAYAGVAVTVEKAPGVDKAEGPVVLSGRYKFP